MRSMDQPDQALALSSATNDGTATIQLRRISRGSRVWLALALTLTLTLVSCGQGATTIQSRSAGPPDPDDPAAPAADGDASTTTSPEVVTNDTAPPDQPDSGEEAVEDAPEAEESEPVGDPIPEAATVAEIKAVMEDLHGPTSNVAGQMNRIAPFPEIPTPLGADLTATSVRMNNGFSDGRTRYVDVTFGATGTVEDLTTFYETNLATFDWQSISESSESNNELEKVTFVYEMNQSAGLIADEFTIVLSETDKGFTEVELSTRVSSKDDEPTELDARLAAWLGDAPLPEGGQPYDWEVQTTKYTGHKLQLSINNRYDGETQAELHSYIKKNLPTSNYSLNKEEDDSRGSETWIYANSDMFESVQIRVSEIDRQTGIAGFAEIEGDLDFVPNE